MRCVQHYTEVLVWDCCCARVARSFRRFTHRNWPLPPIRMGHTICRRCHGVRWSPTCKCWTASPWRRYTTTTITREGSLWGRYFYQTRTFRILQLWLLFCYRSWSSFRGLWTTTLWRVICPGGFAHTGTIRWRFARVVIIPLTLFTWNWNVIDRIARDGIAVVIAVAWGILLIQDWRICFVVAAYDPQRVDVGPRHLGPGRTRRYWSSYGVLVLHVRELSSDPKSLRTILSKLALHVWWDV